MTIRYAKLLDDTKINVFYKTIQRLIKTQNLLILIVLQVNLELVKTLYDNKNIREQLKVSYADIYK